MRAFTACCNNLLHCVAECAVSKNCRPDPLTNQLAFSVLLAFNQLKCTHPSSLSSHVWHPVIMPVSCAFGTGMPHLLLLAASRCPPQCPRGRHPCGMLGNIGGQASCASAKSVASRLAHGHYGGQPGSQQPTSPQPLHLRSSRGGQLSRGSQPRPLRRCRPRSRSRSHHSRSRRSSAQHVFACPPALLHSMLSACLSACLLGCLHASGWPAGRTARPPTCLRASSGWR